MPPDTIEKLDDTLKAWAGGYISELYEGARHGWTVPGRDVYNEKQAERHYQKLFDLLKRHALDNDRGLPRGVDGVFSAQCGSCKRAHYVSQRTTRPICARDPAYAYRVLWVYRHKGIRSA